MRTTVYARAVVTAVLALTASAAACTGSDDPAGAGRTVAVGIAPPQSLIPGDIQDAAGRTVASALWTGLMDYDPETGHPVGAVAESVSSDDGQVWTIRIKPGWRFHDDSPVTARSFVDAWNATVAQGWHGAGLFVDVLRVQGAGALAAGHAPRMDGLTVVDELSFEVRLIRPLRQFPLALGTPATFPLPESVLRSGDWASFGRQPVGNGPYRLTSPWTEETGEGAGEQAEKKGEVVPYADYGGDAGDGPERIAFVSYADPDSQYDDLLEGELDIATHVPASRHENLDEDFSGRHLQVPGPTVTYLGLPLGAEPYRDTTFRQALSLAIDRETIAQEALGDAATPASSAVPPMVRVGHRDSPCRLCRHDPQGGVALFEEANKPSGTVPIRFARAAGEDTGNRGWVDALAEQLETHLGLEAAPTPVAGEEHEAMMSRGEGDGPFVVRLTMDYPSQQNVLEPLFARDGVAHRAGYRPAGLDALVARGNAAADLEESVRHYRLAENTVLRDLPLIPLWSEHGHAAWSDRVDGLTPAVLGGLRLDRVTLTG